jgi:hypothetical protein
MALAARKHSKSITVDRQPKKRDGDKNDKSPLLNKFETGPYGTSADEYNKKAL